MPEAQSRLFHSIVAVGLSFTAACGGTTTSGSGTGPDATVPSDGAPKDVGAKHPKDAARGEDRATASDGGSSTDSAGREGSSTCTCPFGDAGCPPRGCPSDTGFRCDDAGCCFPCYV